MKRMASALRVLLVALVLALVVLSGYSSADPLDNWHQRTSGTTAYLYGVTYGNGTFVVVGYGAILTSQDGVTWTDQSSGYSTLWLRGVAYGNGAFVAVGSEGVILTSPDGATWTDRSIGYGSYRAVAYGGGSFVAVGASGMIVKSTDNGENWDPIPSGTTNELRAAAYCGGVGCSYPTWTAVGENGVVLESLDEGDTWGPATSAIGIDLNGVTFTQASMNGFYMPRFIAVGEGGYFASDADSWTAQSSGTTETLYGVAPYGHNYVAVGEIGTVINSDGGETWTKRTVYPYKRLFGVAYGSNTFVAVGIDGVIVQSDPLREDFDFNVDYQGWRAVGLFDDLGITPIDGWFVNVAAPWNSDDGQPGAGVIGVGSPTLVQFPASPSGALELHADLLSPDLTAYTEWQSTTGFSYNVTGAWMAVDQPVSVAAILWVKKPDSSIAIYSDGLFHNIPTFTSGTWTTHSVDVSALGIPSGSTITNVELLFKFVPGSWVYGFLIVDHVVPTEAPTLPEVTIVASDATATESPLTTGAFTLTRTGSTAAALTVSWTSGGTATLASGDRLSLPTSVTIPAGSASSAPVVVTPIADGVTEPAETVIMTLKANAAYTIGTPSSATVTITDGTTGVPEVTIVASDATATESPLTTGAFTLTRTGSTAAALTVSWTSGGTATLASGDRLSLPTNPVIPAGSASTTVLVTPIADGVTEPAETVIMTLKANAAYTIGTPSSATVTITDGGL